MALAPGPAGAITRKQAASKALEALRAEDRTDPVIVFGLPSPVRAGSVIGQAGTPTPERGSTTGLSSKLRGAGVRVVRQPVVLRGSRSERAFFFYEDRGPFQLYQHPGLVVLVGEKTGRVQVSRTIVWPPLINRKLPAFLKSSSAYRSTKYRVLYRPWTVGRSLIPSNKNLIDQDPFGPGKPLPSLTNAKRIADRLAAERSCVLRVTDTLPSFWNANELNLTRTYVGTLFEALERANPDFVDERYGGRSGESLGGAVDRLAERGCRDILLYVAGQGYRVNGEPVIHLGTQIRRGGLLAQQNLSAADLRRLIAARPGITFKVKIDAPFAGGAIDGLRALSNVLMVETAAVAGEEAFAFVPEVSQEGRIVRNPDNPAGLLEFTNCELVGLKAFFDSETEIDRAHEAQQNEGVSFLVEMMSRAQELCQGRGFAAALGSSPQLYAPKRGSGQGTNRPPVANPQSVNVPEDAPTGITLTASDPNGDALTFSVTVAPAHGTLSGTAPNLTYTPDANYTGPDSFQFKVDDGKGGSDTETIAINVTETNEAPTITTIGGCTTYIEQEPATTIDGGLTVSDVDDAFLEGAVVTVASNFQTGDELVFTDQLGITGVYDDTSGVLTLSGHAPVSDYRTALRDVGFRNLTNNNPAATKSIEFRADDGSVLGPAASKDVCTEPVNDPPNATATIPPLEYTEDDGFVAVDPNFVVGDPDSADLAFATVQITGNFLQSEDELAFTDQNGITGSYDDTSGTLTLSGTASVANYEAAIRSVTYRNESDDPSSATRTVSVALNDGALDSNTAARDIQITPVNDAPLVTTSGGSTPYIENAAAVQIDGALTVSDPDDTNLEGAEVRITSGFQSGDDLVFVNQNGIAGVYNSGTGVLTLTGTSSVANYQTALRSIQFQSTNDNPSTPKTISFKVNDGDLDSNSPAKNVVVTPVNDNPVLTTSGGTASYTEGGAAAAVDPAITVTDPDSTSLAGATVSITSNFNQADGDTLNFVDQNGISGVYNSGTGVLTLTGTSSVANYQTALRSITFSNTSDNPSTATRTVSFQADDGGAVDNLSNVATRDVTVAGVNDAPVVNTSAGNTSYTEGDPATTIDGALTVTDADDTNIEGGQVRISSGFQPGDDLVFVDQNGISGVYNTGTGVLTLSGTSSVANYQTALRSVQYRHTGDNPSASKTVEFKVNDGDVDSNLATKNISVTPVNDAPAVDASSGSASYTEGGAAAAVDPSFAVADPDDTNLESAVVSITTNFTPADGDTLNFVDQNGISGAYNSGTGVLTLTGTSSVANYQTAIRSITFSNTSDTPSTATRTVSFKVNDGDVDSNTDTRDVTVAASNDAPVVNTSAGSTSYTEGDPATTIDGALTVTDADDTNIEGGQVRISSGFQSGDDLVFVDQNGISGVYNTGTGVLTLSGTASKADYQTALRSIQFRHTGDNPSASKTVEFKVNDGDVDSNLATKNIAITAVNDAPVVQTSTTDDLETYTVGSGGAQINPSLTVTDPDDTTLDSGTVSISSGFEAGDDLLFADQNGITGSYNALTGVLTLTTPSGEASVSDWQAALSSVAYDRSVATVGSGRTVEFVVNDGTTNSAGGAGAQDSFTVSN